MSNILTIELDSLTTSGIKIVSFPMRTQVKEVSFTISPEARGMFEDERIWNMYAVGAHPTPTVENPFSEWAFPIFNGADKPIVESIETSFVSTTKSPNVQYATLPNGGGILNLELNFGVFAPGDYMAVWVEQGTGNFDGMDASLVNGVVTVVYQPTALKTVWEQGQANPWLD